jgi:hypothetical protein
MAGAVGSHRPESAVAAAGAAAPRSAQSHSTVPCQVTRRTACQTDGTGITTSFRGVLSYACNGRFALGTVAARGIKPVDTPAALSH